LCAIRAVAFLLLLLLTPCAPRELAFVEVPKLFHPHFGHAVARGRKEKQDNRTGVSPARNTNGRPRMNMVNNSNYQSLHQAA